ncbi:MAG: squalene--hopene cyclase [Verrucomicrobiae bacterium]|nr:squalene--hopene cyclase [Verrucomicrobiae bacterium]
MSADPTISETDQCHQTVRAALLAERNADGFWAGELSASPLSTATAVCALTLAGRMPSRGERAPEEPARAAPRNALCNNLIRGGLRYLADHQNADGGWGDTEKSFSNISTTMLARAAFQIAGAANEYRQSLDRAEGYITRTGGIEAVRARYGKDKTFAAPILMTCALAGLADWSEVDPLPFELACLPPRFFAALRLPVVSYALPALIAIGQARFAKRPPRNPLLRVVRAGAIESSLRLLEAIQPSSGGFLEATPLTSFVTMALASAGRADHPVSRKCVELLVNAARPDGSWPIDSNLSCWLTTLAVNALGGDLNDHRSRRGDEAESGSSQGRMGEQTRDWILARQFRARHPYTNAAPGGWGWTHLPGSVPDADDTAGALLALSKLPVNADSREAARHGVQWLLDLQNRDGGWPTFCRGWTNLPFDRSGADLTAHAMRALAVWNAECGMQNAERTRRAIAGGFDYLARAQQPDGSWLPLWFGNQHADGEGNPVYGTARVLEAYQELGLTHDPAARRGLAWLMGAQNPDGGWGGAAGAPSSVEETSLAVNALAGASGQGGQDRRSSLTRGTRWLLQRVAAGKIGESAPIGFYFAKLWYFEKLYPLIFATAALRRAAVGGKEQTR